MLRIIIHRYPDIDIDTRIDRQLQVTFLVTPTVGVAVERGMGKHKPPKAQAGGARKGKDSGGGLVLPAVVGAVLIAVFAYALLGPGAPPEEPPHSSVGGSGGRAGGGSGQPSSRPRRPPKRELSAFELRQQGRIVPGADRKKCVDGGRCAGVTADQCESEEVSSRCCLSCFKLTCVDKDPRCAARAQKGGCYLDAEWMNATCCFACSPDPEDHCSPDPRKRPDVAEGDLSKIFQRAVDNYPQYSPTILSRDPWVVHFDSLLTDEETDGIYEAVGGKNGEHIKPSTTAQVVNGVLKDVPDQIRTSHNAWCQHSFCYNHPIHERVISRISAHPPARPLPPTPTAPALHRTLRHPSSRPPSLTPHTTTPTSSPPPSETNGGSTHTQPLPPPPTPDPFFSPTPPRSGAAVDIVGLPHDHAEHMQLLAYGPGQYYRLHHDWIDQQMQALCGPRVYTFFLYLSDVEEGGGTQFPYLKDNNGEKLTVHPKRGSAVWWPHGREDNPWQKDDRTHHEAMPVIKGFKKAGAAPHSAVFACVPNPKTGGEWRSDFLAGRPSARCASALPPPCLPSRKPRLPNSNRPPAPSTPRPCRIVRARTAAADAKASRPPLPPPRGS